LDIRGKAGYLAPKYSFTQAMGQNQAAFTRSFLLPLKAAVQRISFTKFSLFISQTKKI
jgi:hypothetical protein